MVLKPIPVAHRKRGKARFEAAKPNPDTRWSTNVREDSHGILHVSAACLLYFLWTTVMMRVL